MNVEIGTEAAQFLFWEHIYGIFVAVYYKGHLQSLVASSQCPEEAYWSSIAGYGEIPTNKGAVIFLF
jgi:hypothetical protein